MHIISPVHTSHCQKNKLKQNKADTRDVSTPKLVISITLPTLTQLCFSSAGNSLRCSSLILLHFISLGHKSYFEEKEQGAFKVHHGSYSPIYQESEQSLGVMGERFPNLQSHPRQPHALATGALWQELPMIPGSFAKLQESSTPKKKLQLSDIPRKTVVFYPQTPTISPKLIISRF